MNRFYKDKKTSTVYKSLILPLLIFGLLFFFFYAGIISIAQTSANEAGQSLETALNHAIVHHYSIEGRYPENLDAIIKHYGITYDQSKYLIDYQPIAANIMPTLTVIRLEDTRESQQTEKSRH